VKNFIKKFILHLQKKKTVDNMSFVGIKIRIQAVSFGTSIDNE